MTRVFTGPLAGATTLPRAGALTLAGEPLLVAAPPVASTPPADADLASPAATG